MDTISLNTIDTIRNHSLDTLTNHSGIFQHWFGVSNQTAFTTIVPTIITILVALATILINHWLEVSKIKAKKVSVKSFVKSQLLSIIDAGQKQRQFLDEYIASLKQRKVSNSFIQISAHFNTKHLLTFKQNELFESLVINSQNTNTITVDDFSELLELLDLIDGSNENIKSAFNELDAFSNNYIKDWNVSVSKIRDLHDYWMADNSVSIDEPFINKFFGIYKYWSGLEDRTDMYVLYDNIILPTLELSKRFVNKHSTTILRPILDCQAAFRNYESIKELHIISNQDINNELGLIISRLQSVTDRIHI